MLRRYCILAWPWLAALAAAVVLGTCIIRFSFYSLPMLRGDFQEAAVSGVGGDRAVALFNMGINDYIAHDYDGARRSFEKALAECCDSTGEVESAQRWLAAECHFFIGASHHQLGKKAEAAAAYERCLTLEPSHLLAKYNLEKLQETEKSKGGGQGQGNNPGQPRKRI